MRMTRDELEYAISQYLDGVLPPLERSALEERLAGDLEARAILAEYQALDASLKSSMPVPEIEWTAFTSQIKQALADEPTPLRHFSIQSIGWTQRLAIAAGLLFVISMTIWSLRPAPTSQVAKTSAPTPPTTQAIVIVTGPSAAQPTGAVVEQIKIGPAPNLANQWRASEEIIIRPTIVQIDRGNSPAQDSDLY